MYDMNERLDFIRFSQDDREALRRFREIVEPNIDDILEAFYSHISRHPSVSRFFSNEQHMAHAKKAQRTHWLNLFSATFDQNYFHSVREIGRTHSRIGLEPRWYIGGYSLVLADLLAVAARMPRPWLLKSQAKPSLEATLSVISRAVLLDIELALSVYLDEEKATHDRFVERIGDEFSSSVLNIVTSLKSEAGTIGDDATQLHVAANDAGDRARAVADASLSASANVQMVASAIEEMAVSIREISSHLSRQVSISTTAMESGRHADEQAHGLTDCAQRIGDAVKLISDVAAQTNLLALNATIEAARAGEAGKGFAVVAHEVKALANQVARATAEIGQLVNEVRSVAVATAASIQQVTGTIGQLDEATGAIATAVEQQSAATRTIAENVHQAVTCTETVTSNISQVRDVVQMTERCADSTRSGVSALASQACHLHTEVNAFIGKLRA
ncbi:MAG: globin-coupled sensor protein [Magnetospirillum sp.]|nr:globin-coupled sensor protein [Magnetospirillum sp.]